MASTKHFSQYISPEIHAKIKQLQLISKRKMNSLFVGDYRTRQKGYGIDFDQLREYNLGDDTRFIDWKSSARSNKMLVKQYVHEQSKTIILMIDVSRSMFFGSSENLKRHTVAQIGTILSVAARYDNARLGLLLYSEDVEYYVPPKSGGNHCNFIIDRLWHFNPEKKGTNLTKACSFLTKHASSDALVCLISDFIGSYDESALSLVAKKFDTVAIRCLDAHEKKMPSVGFLNLTDSETGDTFFVDARTRNTALNDVYHSRLEKQKNAFAKIGIAFCDVETPLTGIDSLITFFAYRLS